jgi:uncharacterized membrane protein HdeD (DUF308 family)
LGNAFLNWGILVLGLIIFFVGFKGIIFTASAYKHHARRFGRMKGGDPLDAEWSRADNAGGPISIILPTAIALLIVGLPLYFLTGLTRTGIPLFIGCTLIVSGIILVILCTSITGAMIKRAALISLSNEASGTREIDGDIHSVSSHSPKKPE